MCNFPDGMNRRKEHDVSRTCRGQASVWHRSFIIQQNMSDRLGIKSAPGILWYTDRSLSCSSSFSS